MTEKANNFLIRLHRWAHKQDENFTTEAFVYVIEYLLDMEYGTGKWFLTKLTDGFLNLSETTRQSINIATQAKTDQGTPDIEITTDGSLVYIEVKVDSTLEHTQLERYRKALETSGVSQTLLVLLTRYSNIEGETEADISFRWYQVADWLNEALQTLTLPESIFLVQQFVDFLHVRKLTFNAVEGDITNSIRLFIRFHQERKLPRIIRRLEQLTQFEELIPLHNVLMMLSEILTQSHVSFNAKLYSGKHRGGWIGFTFDNLKYFIGFYYNDPEHVTFDTNTVKIDKQKYQHIKKGNLFTTNKRLRWENKLDLTSPTLNFYHHPKEQQMKVLTNFFTSSYDVTELIKKIKVFNRS